MATDPRRDQFTRAMLQARKAGRDALAKGEITQADLSEDNIRATAQHLIESGQVPEGPMSLQEIARTAGPEQAARAQKLVGAVSRSQAEEGAQQPLTLGRRIGRVLSAGAQGFEEPYSQIAATGLEAAGQPGLAGTARAASAGFENPEEDIGPLQNLAETGAYAAGGLAGFGKLFKGAGTLLPAIAKRTPILSGVSRAVGGAAERLGARVAGETPSLLRAQAGRAVAALPRNLATAEAVGIPSGQDPGTAALWGLFGAAGEGGQVSQLQLDRAREFNPVSRPSATPGTPAEVSAYDQMHEHAASLNVRGDATDFPGSRFTSPEATGQYIAQANALVPKTSPPTGAAYRERAGKGVADLLNRPQPEALNSPGYTESATLAGDLAKQAGQQARIMRGGEIQNELGAIQTALRTVSDKMTARQVSIMQQRAAELQQELAQLNQQHLADLRGPIAGLVGNQPPIGQEGAPQQGGNFPAVKAGIAAGKRTRARKGKPPTGPIAI